MQKFNVLDRSLNLHRHYLLEASAGTGKTFSIQNIVVRLLIESHGKDEPLLLPQILVVTFTRAAVRDLKFRIRSNIEQALLHLQEWLSQGTVNDSAPDYLRAYMEQGEEAVQRVRQSLLQALFAFDQGQILTIHAFCGRLLKQFALESDWGFHSFSNEELLPESEVFAIIRDFFRSEIRLEKYSPSQLEILLKGDPDQRKLLRLLQRNAVFPSLPSFKASYHAFIESMARLKSCFSLNSEKMLADFQNQAAAYRNFKSGETKEKTLNKVSRFARLFDQEEWSIEAFDALLEEGLVWTQALNPTLLKGTSPSPSELHYPSFTQELEKELKPILRGASDFSVLLARLAADCQKLLKRYQREEEKLSPDDLLVKMKDTLDRPDFLLQVQSHYRAVMIDEFQDTDPLQWQIFQRLFLSDCYPWKGYLYLVGDPKQSIYSFRQADVYTYLAAAQFLGEKHCFSLDVNYRSQPRLVRALNLLFSSESLPQFISLPRHSSHLPYQPVLAGQVGLEQGEEGRGAIHFFLADGQAFKKGNFSDLETHLFFPFIAQEITELRAKKGGTFRQFAVLVRDRHQALRLAQFFDQCHIPYLNQRGMSLIDSPVFQGLKDILRAILHPYSRGAICTALGSPLMGWTQEELRQWEEKDFVLMAIQHLRFCLFEKGFAFFFDEMLRTSFRPDGKRLLESLFSRQEGSDLYRDLQQMADLIIDHQYRGWNSPEGILPFLHQLSIWDTNDDERIKRFQDPSIDGVKILTLHFSKGLEFDIVFALGLANRISLKEELIPVESEGQRIWTPLEEDSEDYQRFYEESDAEKMRQLYVALTRAKERLYLPLPLHLPSDHLKKGEASPMDLFLARFARPPAVWEELYQRVRSETGQSLIKWIEERGREGGEISYSLCSPISFERPVGEEGTFSEALFAPPVVSLSYSPLWMASFSTLSYHVEHAANERFSLTGSFPKDFDCSLKTGHTLPANRETGLFIHGILEKISFQDFNSLETPEEALPLIRPFIRKTLFEEWEGVIAHLIFTALRIPLPSLPESFCLASLSPLHFYREMSFLFPCKRGEELEGVEFQEGFVKGVIDLLFYHEGMYYLVDWKTNWLGGALETYAAPFLHAAMQENAYFLQAAIYMEAVKRYLRLIESRPFEECFGGAFYLFLRGLSPGQETGIYHFLPVFSFAS